MSKWTYGGNAELFGDLTWSNRPDMTGSDAPEGLEDAWVATVLAVRDVVGSVRDGSCFLINLAATPLVEKMLGEPAQACAGYAGFIGRKTRFECGFRWRPEKWRDWVDADAGAHLSPQQDIHAWIETRTHVIDFSTGDAMGDPDDLWPPLVYRPKWRLPKHPREAKGAGAILLWRDARALGVVRDFIDPLPRVIGQAAADILRTQSAVTERRY